MNKKTIPQTAESVATVVEPMFRLWPDDGSIDKMCAFSQLSDQSKVGICVVHEGVIRYCNPALAQLWSREREQILGNSLLEFIHPDDRTDVEQHMSSLLWGHAETSRFEARSVYPEDDLLHLDVLHSLIYFGGERALMCTMTDISARKRAEEIATDRLRFERLLADIAARFINVPVEESDQLIADSLKRLVECLGNDRSTLVECENDQNLVVVSHSCAVPGYEPFPLGNLPVDRLPWFIGQFRSGKIVFLRNLPDELPPEATNERQYCITHGLKSNVTVPLQADGKILGAITFAFMSRRCDWPEEIVSRLQVVGELFAFARLRVRTERSLREALVENEKLRLQLKQENVYLREQITLQHEHGKVFGRSEAITRVLKDAERVAVTDAPVLLLGETGTGKGLVAQTIHDISRRNDRPMITVNCASLPATLIESELFGREAGAYTGAASAQEGRFMLANRSTLFLDEIGELPLELQTKFLRVLQDGCFERLGSPSTITVDVRIIAATNRDLKQAVQEGKFRLDLYHRLNVFPIHVPPLRERPDDIPPLVWSYVEKHGQRMGKTIRRIPGKTMEELRQYSWPGNVRELSNVIERAIILTNDDTLHVQLPDDPAKTSAPRQKLKESEFDQILSTLKETGWRIRGENGAAEILGMKPTTLEARMVKLGIKRP